jgi:aspartate kinase
VTERKMRVGGIQVYRHLSMISILGTPHGPGTAGVVLETLGNAGVNVEFISCCPDSGGGDNIVVCVERTRLAEALALLETVREHIRPLGLKTREGLVCVAVFGPHFREIPAAPGRIFRALADAGINLLAISTSVSSVTSLFEEAMLDRGIAALHERFEVG